VLRVLGAVVDAVAVAGATVDATARPCPFRTAERLAQQLIQAEFAGAYPEPEYKRLQHLAATADPADDSAPVRHARNLTVRARDLGVAREARARLSACCAASFIDYDVLLCPITPTTAIPHDHQRDVDARRIIVNGRPRPYGQQIPGRHCPACADCLRWCCPPASPAGCPSGFRSSDPDWRIGQRSTSRPESRC
jgi:amidase